MWCVHGIHTLPHFLPSKLEVRSCGSYFLIEERVGEVTSSRWGWRAAFIREKGVSDPEGLALVSQTPRR